jgi:hypothetical protein
MITEKVKLVLRKRARDLECIIDGQTDAFDHLNADMDRLEAQIEEKRTEIAEYLQELEEVRQALDL